MKHCTIKFALIIAAVLLGITRTTMGGFISGSAHDFSALGWSGGKICIACHAPHHTDVSTTDAPLWNHEVTAAAYTLYSSATLDASIGQPSGLSKLCLSCHDGTVAVDNFGGVTTGTSFVSTAGNLGSALNDDHPVGFTYDATLVTTDGALHEPTTTNITIGSGGQTKSGTIANLMLYSGKMECSSCHDVHNTFTADAGTSLVKVTQAGSALCLTCHNK